MFRSESPTPDRKIKIQHGHALRPGRADDTIKHITKNWLPVNPEVLTDVRGAITSKNGIDRTKVIDGLKCDPGLLLYCVRQLKQLREEPSTIKDPIESLRQLEDEKLFKLLNVTEKEISSHDLKGMGKPQAMRLQHSLISTQAAEAIARRAEIPRGTAFSASFFRQLGLNLVAWNYPRIYSQAIASQRRGDTTIEQEVLRMLGISPLQIGVRLAAEWGMSPEIRRGLSDLANIHDTDLELAPADNEALPLITLSEICSLSDLIAKRSDAETYPNAEAEWEARGEHVKRIVDDSVVELIQQNVKTLLTPWQHVSNSIDSLPLVDATAKVGPAEVRVASVTANQYVLRCPWDVQALFEKVYPLITKDKVALDALRLLSSLVIPKLGFERGCLLLASKTDLEIKPALRFGETALADYERFALQMRGTLDHSLYNPVPIKVEGVGVKGATITYVCGGLDNKRYPGVLYLELSAASRRNTQHNSVLYFLAIRQTINDCLEQQQQ